MSKKTSFFELWRTRKERGELLERANKLRLRPSQLRQLLGDSGVRAALQDTRMASLLPPVGTEIFRRLTPASLEEMQLHEAEKKEIRKKNKEATGNNPVKPASDLEEGKPLPFFYGVPPPELLSTPLEELDPFYQSQKTFIVLGKGNIIHRFNAESVCYLLSPFSPLRTFAIKGLIHSFFTFFIMVTVLTNCVFMTISDPPTWIQIVEHVFTAIYTFEVFVKVVSRGLCVGKFTFLRDPWNWLDVVVVSTGYLTVFVDLGKASVLKTVPRVLKLITVIPGLKKTVGALVQSLKGLAEVIILTVVCLSIFALLGLRFFSGGLRSKCVMWPPNGSTEFDYNEYITSEENYYFLPGHLDALVCGNMSDAGICPEGYLCLRAGRTPNYGYTSYDSFGWSLLSLVRLMSKDFWENLMQLTLRAEGKAFFTIFAVVFFPGCFCLLSLLVAVVAMVSGEREEAGIAELKRTEEEFGRILEALKTRVEEQEVGRASPEQDGEHQKILEGPDQHQTSCSPCWLVFNDFLQKSCGRWQWLVTDPFFDLGVVICLILNTVFMSMEHFPLTPWFYQMLSEAELVFTAIFTAEMVLKLMTMGLYRYFQVGWNIFDSILVIISLLELFVPVNLHCLLVMRVFRLARWWPALHMLIKVMWTSVMALRNLTLVLLIMVFLFSVAGMQLFQQDYKDHICRISVDCILPRWHMNDFYHVFLIIIKVLCGDWIENMWDCMEVSGQTTCLIFFMMVLVIGKLLVLSLFLGLLLSSFSSLAAPELKGRTNLQIAVSRITRAVKALLGKKTHINPYHKEVESKEVDRKEHLTLTLVTSNQPVSKKLPEVQQHEGHEGHEDDHKGDTLQHCCCNKCYHCCPFLDVDTSRGTGRVWSNFRRLCFSIVQHKCFEIFIIIVIVLSCAALVFEDVHLQHRQVLKMLVERADQVFTTVFLMEMVLKWFAFGLKKYFKDVWCWLDFLILQVSLVSLAVNMFGFSELRAVHSLRALLPLRMLSHVQSLKVVVLLLLRTLWSTFDVLLVFLLVWLVFSILGVNMFAGKFYYCFNETSEELFSPETVNNKSDCLSLIMANFTEVRWKSTHLTYDNVPSGYLTLLHMATFDWYDIMYAAVDSSLVESQPIFEYNNYMYLYFFSFIIISSFFTFNLFIRSIFDNLHRDKSAGRPVFMTQEQQKLCQAMKKRVMEPRKVFPRPQNRCQAWLFDLVTKPSFDLFIVVLICFYLVTLMTETDDDSHEKYEVLYWIHFTFIILFLIEFILKVIALRRYYFTGWNIFDFIVIVASISGFFLSDIIERYFISPQLFILVSPQLFLMLRVVHLLRVPLWVKGIRKLLLALMMSLPAVFNIGLLLFIIMFTYSVFGMFNFAYVKKAASIDDMYNFETFGSSMICMFMATPSAGWGGLLRPMMETPPDCDPGVENPGSEVRGNCGSPVVSIIFFVSHIILFFLLVVHLYLAVILETLSAEDTESLSDNDLQMFYKTWRKFDPESSQFIQSSELSDFCDALQDPLKIPKPSPIKLIHKDLPLLPEDRIHFTDVLLAVATQVYGDSGNLKSLKARVEEVFMTNLSKASYGPISSTLTAGQVDEAATVIGQETVVQSVESGGVSAS